MGSPGSEKGAKLRATAKRERDSVEANLAVKLQQRRFRANPRTNENDLY